jgi:hypothetical protein
MNEKKIYFLIKAMILYEINGSEQLLLWYTKQTSA